MANDFIARQTLNGLGEFDLFTTPDTPAEQTYLVDGQITLPTLVGGAGASSVIATLYVDGVATYTGIAGATGFQVRPTIASGTEVTVTLTSSADADEKLNAVKGVVAVSLWV